MVIVFNATGGYPANWPHVLASTRYATPTVRATCEYLVVDSDIRDPATSNEKVVEKARAVGANCVVPKDTFGDWRATVASVREFFKAGEWGSDVLIPLQRPYDKCFKELADFGQWFGLGGLLPLRKEVQFEELKKGVDIVSKAGKDVHLFGIFPSPSTHVFEYLRNGAPVHSLDTTVCETMAVTGRVYDLAFDRYHLINTTGAWSRKLRVKMAELNLTSIHIALNRPAQATRTSKSICFQHLKRPVLS